MTDKNSRMIAEYWKEATYFGFDIRAIKTILRHRKAAADGKPLPRPSGKFTKLYLDALEGRLENADGTPTLKWIVEKIEQLEKLKEKGDTP